MHVHPARLITAFALLLACKTRPASSPPAPAAPAPSLQGPLARADLCAGRPRCSAARQSVAAAAGVDLVTVRLAHTPDASTDEEHCDRREYWLSRASGDLMIAADCAAQWGADNPGPATIEVAGSQLHVSYTEMQSSDGCEVHTATIGVAGPRLIEAQNRVAGTVVKNVCRPGNQQAPMLPAGDGTAGHPLLTLHRSRDR
jgi:hypothetical protein